MTASAKHTPWRASRHTVAGNPGIDDSRGASIASADTREARDAIVRCVNSHDDLLAALRDLLDVIAVDALIPESVAYMKQARAAIAKAEGRS